MQWDGEPGAGFTTSDPWLPLADDYVERNVKAQRGDPASILSLTRRLLELRHASPALNVGRYETVEPGAHQVYAYLRISGPERLLVVLNFGEQPVVLDLATAGESGHVAVCTHMDHPGQVVLGALELRPYEGLVIAVDQA